MPTRKKPTFKRQKALLALIDLFGGELSKLELQKYMFLYVNEFSIDAHYSFVPYHYGSFSYELYRDLNTLERNGFLQSSDHDISALYEKKGLTPAVSSSGVYSQR